MQDWRTFVISQNVSDSPGIYMVMGGNEILYIGSANNLHKRLIVHNKRSFFEACDCTEIRTMVIVDKTARMSTEAYLIAMWSPTLSCQTFVKYTRSAHYVARCNSLVM